MGILNTVVVSACDFGFGSIGKIAHIASHLDGFEVQLDPSMPERLRRVISNELGRPETWAGSPAIALVVNDPRAVDRFADRALQVVMVDSLPYLWTKTEEVSFRATEYLAQKFGGPLPTNSPLLGVEPIRWIGPVVGKRRARSRRPSGVLISVGGLHGHLTSAHQEERYIEECVLPLVRAAIELGVDVVGVCGNLPSQHRDELQRLLPGSTIGIVPEDQFSSMLRGCSGLICSPGSTTILEAANLGVPVATLPPQNLSQILNVRTFLDPSSELALSWSSDVLSIDTVEQLRPEGEDVVLEYIYERIGSAEYSMSSAVSAWAGTSIVSLLRGLTAIRDDVLSLSFDGAASAARVVRQCALAPH